MSSTGAEPTIDFKWFERFLLDDILPHWLEHAVTDEGLFLPQLDRQWRPLPDRHGTVVAQTRLLHNFAEGYRMTGDSSFRCALEAGAQFLADRFRDTRHGGWFHAVGPGGEVVDDHKNAYDHAFVILGFAHAFGITQDDTFKAAMLDAWEILTRRFAEAKGGFVRVMTREFRPNETRRTQNPIMHLFEALLAAGDVHPPMHEEARKIADFVLGRLIRKEAPVCLPEFYDMDWQPLPVEAGGYASVGHQFEWAYLLSAAVERGLPESWLSVADDLLQFGIEYGYDDADGGILEGTAYDGRVLRDEKSWWEPCEAIRALMRHAIRHGRKDLLEPLCRCIRFVQQAYVDDAYGGWYSSIQGEPTDTGPAKGGGSKVDYHVVGMCTEAMRLGTQT
jgi:mannose-6-phosphate isomerase